MPDYKKQYGVVVSYEWLAEKLQEITADLLPAEKLVKVVNQGLFDQLTVIYSGGNEVPDGNTREIIAVIRQGDDVEFIERDNAIPTPESTDEEE